MKNNIRSTAAIALVIAGAMSAGADTTSYSWSGSTNTLPGFYVGGDLNYPAKGGIYEMRSGRLHVSSPGGQGWINNAFDWDTPLTDSQSVTGSITFRINYYTNDVNNLATGLGRVRLFWFNATFANGLNGFVGLYGSDKWTTRNSQGGWHAGGHGEWNKWEYNPSDAGAPAPTGKVYVYNSFNMNDPATDPDFFRAVDKGTDHVLSWSAQYLADCDVVKVTTALDGVPWTVTLVGRQFFNLGWGENALAKQHGSMQGPWAAEYSELQWATTTLPTPAGDTKNYYWNGLGGCLPPLYLGGDVNYPAKGGSYSSSWTVGRLHVDSPGGQGWINNAFDWNGLLADDEKVSGSIKFRINAYENGGDGLGRVRLFWFNATFGNGLNGFVGLYASDKWTTRNSQGGWHAGGHGEWNKWEYNPSDAGAPAPTGKVYVYNSFNMNDPATDPDFFRAVDKGTDHVLSWSAQYLADCDVVKVTTALDGVPWTVTLVGRQFFNLGWGENALAKQHGSMQGPWAAEYSELQWATTTLPAPTTDTKNYYWNGLGGCLPPLYLGGDVNYPAKGGSYSSSWTVGRLHVDSPGGQGWINNAFDWNGALADNEKVSGSIKFRINAYENGGDGLGRVRLFWFNATYANGLNAFVGLYGSDKWTTRNSQGGWHAGGHGEWNKWEYNPSDAGAPAPTGKVYVYNSFNMNDPATDLDFYRAIDKGADHVLSWSAQYVACDVVRVTTALDGVPWTTTDVNRNFFNLGWGENALAKQHGSMQGPWAAEYSELQWVTGPAAPSVCITKLPDGKVELKWPFGSLYEAPDVTGPWTVNPATSPYTVTPVGRKFYRAQ